MSGQACSAGVSSSKSKFAKKVQLHNVKRELLIALTKLMKEDIHTP
jgi:hypothetical protein